MIAAWMCPDCDVENTTEFHPENGPWVTLRCGMCGEDMDDRLHPRDRAAVDESRAEALRAAPASKI